QSVAETLLTLARDPKHLGAHIGVLAVLHTWGQNLMDHPHIHCIVPGGGLSADGTRWIASRTHFFLPVKVLSRLFRGKMLDQLKGAYKANRLKLIGESKELNRPEIFRTLLDKLYKKEWVVYAKEPFGGPRQVLAYLGRYTHRVAISNNRLVSISDGKVTFRWRDYRDASAEKLMTLDAGEFIRRFLLHVLPQGLCKIRYYGIISNRNRKMMLARCRKLLGVPPVQENTSAPQVQWQELLLELTGIDVRLCPECQTGQMIRRRILHPLSTHAP
ncbi:MAG: transposase, partial [Candidatus Eisenbacteria bacterium]|nr:transposase [Candidatus Eisenbacteria bacterium]